MVVMNSESEYTLGRSAAAANWYDHHHVHSQNYFSQYQYGHGKRKQFIIFICKDIL